jgi:hypothetical protein
MNQPLKKTQRAPKQDEHGESAHAAARHLELMDRFPNKPLLWIVDREKTLYGRDDVSRAEKRRPDDQHEGKKREKGEKNVVGEGGGALFAVDFNVNVGCLDNDAPRLAQGGVFFRAHSND